MAYREQAGGMWSVDELRHVSLGDQRLNRRLRQLVYDLAARPMSSVPVACGSWAATKAAYRFWKSERVTAEAIRGGHVQRTIERVSGPGIVLAIQDTTDLDFTTHRAMEGRGPLTFTGYQGLKVHSVLVVSENGVPQGIIHQQVWARPQEPVTKHRRARATSEKESQRWLDGVAATVEAIGPSSTVVTVADREADIFDLFAQARPAHAHLLIRAAYNRRVQEETGHVWEALGAQEAAGTYSLPVARRADRESTPVTVQVKFAPLSVRPPHRGHKKSASAVSMHGILVQELDAPDGVTPIEWCLLTTMQISSWDDAIRAIRWYSYRWLIERYHYVLKSGCQLESLQLQSAEQMEKALATYSIVAWRLLWLVHQARKAPDLPASTVFSDVQWRALYATIHRTTQPPRVEPTLRQTVRWVAQLGGFLARKGDGEPGVKTLWLGLRRLDDIVATWQLLAGLPPAPTYG